MKCSKVDSRGRSLGRGGHEAAQHGEKIVKTFSYQDFWNWDVFVNIFSKSVRTHWSIPYFLKKSPKL